MSHLALLATVDQALRYRFRQSQFAVSKAYQQQAGVRGDITAIESSNDFPTT